MCVRSVCSSGAARSAWACQCVGGEGSPGGCGGDGCCCCYCSGGESAVKGARRVRGAAGARSPGGTSRLGVELVGSGHVEARTAELEPPAGGEGPGGLGSVGFQGADPRVVAWRR